MKKGKLFGVTFVFLLLVSVFSFVVAESSQDSNNLVVFEGLMKFFDKLFMGITGFVVEGNEVFDVGSDVPSSEASSSVEESIVEVPSSEESSSDEEVPVEEVVEETPAEEIAEEIMVPPLPPEPVLEVPEESGEIGGDLIEEEPLNESIPSEEESNETVGEILNETIEDSINESIEIPTNESEEILSNESIIDETGEIPDVPITEPLVNESLEGLNQTSVVNETLVSSRVVVGRPVKWVKKIVVEGEGKLESELPKQAEGIVVKTGEEARVAEREIEEENDVITSASKREIISMTGNAVRISSGRGFLTRLTDWLFRGVTGKVIYEEALEVSVSGDSLVVDLSDVSSSEDIAIEYYTPGPEVREEVFVGGKRVVVYDDNEIGYENILAYTLLEGELQIEENDLNRLRLYWIGKNGNKTSEDFEAFDLDEDGLIDYIEWNVPHLSEQEYEIILITKASHLDSNREFIENVFEEVSELDGVWFSVTDGNYLRVVFEQNLVLGKDMTIYAKGTGTINVYNENSAKSIGEFVVDGENEYKIYPDYTNSDVYDLLFSGNIEVDYIVDPEELPYIYYNGSKLYIHPTDNSAGAVWGCSGINTGASSDTNGTANTIAASACTGPKICADLVSEGYEDWYLPAKNQLSTMYDQKDNVTKGGYAGTWADYVADYYWSSTERSDDPEYLAWHVDFIDGVVTDVDRDGSARVRCVRDYTEPAGLQCGDTITSDLTLTEDLTCEGDALIIGADNVTIDGQGFTITGNVNASNATGNAYTGLNISNVTIVGDVVANGGDNYSGGGVNVANSIIDTIIAMGGSGLFGEAAGTGGAVIITNSIISIINTTGGSMGSGSTPGEGGSVIITNSNITTIITLGGSGGMGTPGGTGGNLTIMNSVFYLNGSINLGGGDSFWGDGANGTLILNQSSLKNDYGEIKFSYVSTNQTNFTEILSIGNNSAVVDSATYSDYNVSANVTLNGLSTEYTNPEIKKDGVACTDCYNFTSLNAGTVIFNVTSWTNYSIGEVSDPFEITECKTLNESGTYTLLNNLTAVSTCLNITADNVIVDGDGYSILGDGGDVQGNGIYAVGRNNITLKNFADIGGFDYSSTTGYAGIYFENVNDSIIQDVSVSYNYQGIYLSSSSNNTFYNTTSTSNNGNGIWLSSSSNNTFYTTSTSNNYEGIYLSSSSNYNTFYTTSTSNNGYGIYLSASSDNTFYNTTSSSNTQGGIYLYSGSNYNTFYTTSTSNNDYGIYLSSSSNNTFYTTSTSNNYEGIYLGSSSNNTFYNTTSTSNGDIGIYLSSSSNYNTFYNTTSTSNNWNGIYLYSSSNNTFYNTTSTSNNEHGIYLYSSSNNTFYTTSTSNNMEGILLSSSSNNTFYNTTSISNVDTGIQLSSSSNYNTFYTTSTSNNYEGIYLGSSSNYNTFYNTTSTSNSEMGISLGYSSNNTFYTTSFSGSSYGISLYSSSNNIFNNLDCYSNSFENIFFNYEEVSSIDNILIYNNSFGEIEFASLSQDISGDIRFGEGYNINIENNSAYLNSTALPELNVSANVTLLDTGIIGSTTILKDGAECSDCVVLWNENDDYTFNVTSWTNYSIGEGEEVPYSFDITECRTLSQLGTHTLLNDIGSGGDCLIINADNVTIEGQGFTITGNVNASNATGPAYTNLNVSNVTIVGDVLANGGDNNEESGTGYSGGNITIADSIIGNITSRGGNAPNVFGRGGIGGIISVLNTTSSYLIVTGGSAGGGLGTGGNGGRIIMNNSNVTDVDATGGTGLDYGGSGGSIYIYSSDSVFVTAVGGSGIMSGGSGGSIVITGSNISVINSSSGMGWSAGNAGSVAITNSDIGVISAEGKGDPAGAGGSGGSVNISGSNVTRIETSGAIGGGSGGSVNISSSIVGNITSNGAVDGIAGYVGNGGGGIITNSSVVKIISLGGGADSAVKGGSGGSFVITDSNITEIISTAGYGLQEGGDGGSFTILNSNITSMSSLGGDSWFGGIHGTGGQGGFINCTNSIIRIIDISGGFGDATNEGGSSGNLSLIDSIILLNGSINLLGGTSGEGTPGLNGTLILNQTTLSNSNGSIKFSYVNTNQTNLTEILSINNNSAVVDSATYSDYNVSANVTLNGLSTEYTNPEIKKDGVACTDCYNFTSLNAGTVIFNVTSWTNYSIGEVSDPFEVTECKTLNESGTYTLLNNLTAVSTCLTITADDVIVDGQGYSIIGDGGDVHGYGIHASGRNNITLKNFADINGFDYFSFSGFAGIYFENVSDSIIQDVSVSFNYEGIYLDSSSNNTFYTTSTSNNMEGIYLSSSSDNTFYNTTSSSNSDYGIFLFSSSNNTFYTTSTSNNIYGIFLSSSSDNIFYNTTSSSNSDYGILLSSSSNNTFYNTTSTSNNWNGIYLYSSSNNTFYNTTSTSNNWNGIYLYSSSNNTFYNTTSTSNNWNGIYLYSSSNYNTFYNTTPTSNGDNGILLSSSSNNIFNNLDCYSNSVTGIYSDNWGASTRNILDYNNSFGEIEFASLSQDISGDIRFGEGYNINIENNSAYLNSTALPELNISANVTLLDTGIIGSTTILKDGVECSDCVVLWNENDDYTFNVTSWTNYSIGEVSDPFEITECKTLNESGTYTLLNNLTAVSTCLNITADDVIVDGGEYSIIGSVHTVGVYGVYASGVDNLTIRNLRVTGFYDGIRLNNTNNSLITNNIAYNNTGQDGIGVYNLLNSNITNNIVYNNGDDGIFIGAGSNSNRLINNTAYLNPAEGLSTDDALNTYIANNNASSNTNFGILIQESNNSIVINNIVDSNGQDGISIYKNSSNNFVGNNTINMNGTYGIRIFDYSNNNTIVNNSLSNLGGYSIYVVSSSDNILNNIEGNISSSNWSLSTGNVLIYNNSLGEVEFSPVEGDLPVEINFGESLNISSGKIEVSGELLGESTGLNSSANIKFVGAYNSQYPLRYFRMLVDGALCDSTTSPTCINFTGLNETEVRFNISSLGNGMISLGFFAEQESSVSLDSGWNLVAISDPRAEINPSSGGDYRTLSGDDVDVNITLSKGWNLIGYSGLNENEFESIAEVNGTNWTAAYLAGTVQKYISYYDNSENYTGYKFTGLPIAGHSPNVSRNTGYWVYSHSDDPINLTLRGVGEVRTDYTYNLSSLLFRNESSGEVRNISGAVSDGWAVASSVDQLVWVYNPTGVGPLWKKIPTDSSLCLINPDEWVCEDSLNSWSGYFVNGAREGIKMLVVE